MPGIRLPRGRRESFGSWDRRVDQQRRLEETAAEAHRAQDRGDHAGANEAWRRYVLIEDALRDPQDLLDEGVGLSKVAIDLWLQR